MFLPSGSNVGRSLLLFILVTCYAVFARGGPNINLGVMFNEPPTPLDTGHLKPAVDTAVDFIRTGIANGYFLNLTIRTILRESFAGCSNDILNIGPGLFNEMVSDHDINVLIGHPCSYEMIGIGDLAAYLNIPIITGATTAPEFRDKTRFPTMTRTSFRSAEIANCVLKVFVYFNWTRCAIINGKRGLVPQITAPAIVQELERKNYTVNQVDSTYFKSTEQTLSVAVEEARVIIVALKGEQVRDVMITAHRMGLINGDYVFIAIEPFKNTFYFGNYDWKRGDEYDDVAKEAYEALIIIKLFEPNTQEYFEFQNELRRREREDYNLTVNSDTDRNFFANAFYDAVILYSLAVNETLAEGGDIRDGYTLTRRMWNRTFEGISGPVTINANGDRDANYVAWDMTDTENGIFHEIFDYYGTTDVLVPSPTNKPAWAGGRTEAPPDSPFCGFQNENPVCKEELNATRSILITVSLTFLFMIVASGLVLFFVSRRMALNAELMKMSWMIKWSDLVFEKLRRSSLSHSMSMSKEYSVGDVDQVRATVGSVAYFQGRVVLVTNINKDKIELTRDVLVELRNMRQLDHTNIVRFIGACVDRPNIAIIQEHCPKGSLEDILHNDDLKLDWTFKFSLISDVIQGLHFIHGSSIETHGRLTSASCFVDSRFVLKLGHHGLHLFRKDEKPNFGEQRQMYGLLWNSPERLRGSPISKEADIYSAGIVLTEIITRMEPYEQERAQHDIADILIRIRVPETPPYRQTIPECEADPSVLTLIEKCMSEKPENRPTITAMLAASKKINRNMKGGSNLLDNLLARMEQYATNLEKLVEERTAAFWEEKKKAETLLYEVLPKTVADQLKQGQSVKPEAYESVTIFFSDIVGFTAMSALSTPFQVVAFLNDLYTCFDEILCGFDVYKVETIGDAYMVVSGLPLRNGNAHAREIANMSLVLIDASSTFEIRHFPERKLMLRVGIHSGSCVAGVVGLKMPRYCLFGDTVNTASRMESNGEALRIHISESTQDILLSLGGFKIEYRGEIELNGKGLQPTYWLISSDTKPEREELMRNIKPKRPGKPEIIEVKDNIIEVQETVIEVQENYSDGTSLGNGYGPYSPQ